MSGNIRSTNIVNFKEICSIEIFNNLHSVLGGCITWSTIRHDSMFLIKENTLRTFKNQIGIIIKIINIFKYCCIGYLVNSNNPFVKILSRNFRSKLIIIMLYIINLFTKYQKIRSISNS